PVLPVCPLGTIWVDDNDNGLADQGECQIPPTPAPTPTPPPLPGATVLAATPTPLMELPSTGPGAAVMISMIGLVSGLLAKKHHLLDRFSRKTPTDKPEKYNHSS